MFHLKLTKDQSVFFFSLHELNKGNQTVFKSAATIYVLFSVKIIIEKTLNFIDLYVPLSLRFFILKYQIHSSKVFQGKNQKKIRKSTEYIGKTAIFSEEKCHAKKKGV